MLTLTLKGQTIPLTNDFSMRLTWKSPVTDFEKIPSGYGLGLTFPINEYTRALFGNAERFAKYRAGNDQKFAGFEVRFSGVLLMAGTLSITSASGGSYEATLIDQVGVLGEKEQERDILDIVKFKEEIRWENSSNYSPSTHKYCCFPVTNRSFFKDKGALVQRTVTQPREDKPELTEDVIKDFDVLSFLFDKTTKAKVNSLLPDRHIDLQVGTIDLTRTQQKNNTYEVGKVTAVSPFFFLKDIIYEALKANQFYFAHNFLKEDDQLKKLCIYNNYDITVTEHDTTYTVHGYARNVNYGSNGEPFDLDQQEWTALGKNVVKYQRSYQKIVMVDGGFPDYGIWMKPKNHLPKMKLADLILSTQNLFNLCYHFMPNNMVSVYSREEIMKGAPIDLDAYFLGDWAIGEKKKVSLQFVWEHDQNDLTFSERYEDLSDRRADFKAAKDSWGDLLYITNPVEGEIRFLKYDNIFVEYRWGSNSMLSGSTYKEETRDVLGWFEISIGFQNGWFQYGCDEVEEIKTLWSTCAGKYYVSPTVDQQGNMDSWKAKQQDFSPRLMISEPNNQGGNANTNFALDWEKAETGLLAKYWKNWNPFWANRLAVSGSFDLPVNVLRHVIYNICSKYRTREGEFLIEEMSCELFTDRIGETEVKGFKVE